ncbi:2863_t:CDS:2 [Entrophospora sp. SA101]|nr:2863_t:CDS:2 [Entrophospora sp. SA101]
MTIGEEPEEEEKDLKAKKDKWKVYVQELGDVLIEMINETGKECTK